MERIYIFLQTGAQRKSNPNILYLVDELAQRLTPMDNEWS